MAIFLDLTSDDWGWIQDGLTLHNVYIRGHGKSSAHIRSQNSGVGYVEFFKKLISGFKKDIENVFIVIDLHLHFEKVLDFKKEISTKIGDSVSSHEGPNTLTVKLRVDDGVAEGLNIFFKVLDDVFKNSKEKTRNIVPIYYSLGYLGIVLANVEQVLEYIEKINLIGGKEHFKEYIGDF